MSVYQRQGSPYYWAEFWIGGVRFRVSTEKTDRREAVTEEKRIKARKKAEIETERARNAEYGGKAPPELGYLVARYWEEVGQFHAASQTTWTSMEWLVDHFGASTLITDIDADKIARMVARRRAVKIHRDKDTRRLVETPTDSVKNATVNRYATEPLRKLFVRARDVWGYSIRSPKWGDLLLAEPAERVREASPDEEAAIIEALGGDYGRLFRFMMATGLRSQAALLTWPQVDLINEAVRVRNKAKDGQERWYAIPLVGAAIEILRECEGHHETNVFTYAARRDIGRVGDEGYRKAGVRYPITDSGFRTEWRRCVTGTGIAPGFRRHDTRHTVGTRFLRATGNLKATQKLLGHSRIETTTRYAHVLVEDIRAGLSVLEHADARNAHKNAHRTKKKVE